MTDARSHVTTSVYDDFGRERQVVSPDAGTNASVYDEAGNLVSRSNALGERAEFSWDALNRPVRLQWPGSVRAVELIWDQDTAGRLTGIQEEEFERRFGYDGLGRVTQERVSREGVSLSVGYGYDEATGELSSITYPSGTVLQYSYDAAGRIYDAAGRISGLRFGEHDLARDIRYLPFGPVTGMRLGGVNLSRSYDQRYQASRIQAGSLDYIYTRNAAGQVTESKGLAVPAVESGSESYSIDAASNQLTVRAGKNYSYDAAGRLLSDGVRSFGWDALGRLKTVRRNGQEVAGYGYDSQNRRVRKTVGAKTTYYLYDLENRLLAEIAGNGRVLREYVWLGQEPVALREYELRPGLYFYINDHLGTPQQLVDSQGTVVWQAAALPFGSTQVQLGTVQNNLRFPGQYFDAETGLHYNWNRYYDPDTGRYLSPDPIGLEGGLNLYAYVENDPVNWVDMFGLYCCNSDGSVNTNEECCKDRPASEKAGAWAQYQYEQGNQDYTFAADNPSAGGPNQWKCNSFVRDALNKGGGVSWSDLPKSYSNGKKSKYAARANDYANTSLNTDVLDTIDGSNLKLGDIVAWPSSSGSGHVGIVGCDGKIYNARGDGIDRYNPTWGYSNFYYRWKKRNPVYRRPVY